MVQFQPSVDTSFAALSDPTRRGVLEQLGRSDFSISELAEKFQMTLTGMKKHVGVLEQAGLVTCKSRHRPMGCGGRDGPFWFFGVGLPLGMSRSLLMPQVGTESARANASESHSSRAAG